MAFLFSLCLVVVATLYGVCQAQCVIRTLVPMTMMDSCGCCTDDGNSGSTSAEDLNALLLLARALEMDRAKSSNNCVDVNGLVKGLIDALVYIATLNAGRSQTEWPGRVPDYTNHGNMPTGQAPGGKPTSGNMSPGSTPTGSQPGTGTGTTSPSGGTPKGGDDALVGVGLLGSGKNNVADVSVAGKTIVGVGLGGNDENDNSGSSSGAGLLGRLGDSVGGLLNNLNL